MIYEPIWGAIIAWYLFLAGLGGGAFATAVFVRYRHPECKRLMRVGRLIAPIVVIIGLCLLMFDAAAGFAHPLRFALLLTNFGSVMTWGVVFLAVFVVVALIVLVLDLMKREVPMWLDCVGLVMGLCVAIYTGCLLGVCQGFPCGTARFCRFCSLCLPYPPAWPRCFWSACSTRPTSSTRSSS